MIDGWIISSQPPPIKKVKENIAFYLRIFIPLGNAQATVACVDDASSKMPTLNKPYFRCPLIQ